MNAHFKLSALFAFVALVATRLSAGVEPLKIEPTVDPQLSPTMQMEGVTKGKIVVAVAVNEEGKLTDYLVLAYTHPALVNPCIEALKQWRITPARIDGRPVAAQTELTIDYSAEGVVISRCSVVDLDQRMQQLFGVRFASYPRSARELDSAPVRLSTVMPRYAKQAAKDGVKGTVEVYFYIDATGTVRMPAVEEGAHPYLSDAAVAALREWRFQPPTSHGQPVLIAARQEFKFGN